MTRFRIPLITAIASAITVLAGYFLGAFWQPLAILRAVFTRWAALLAAVALLVASLNLINAHFTRVRKLAPGFVNSLALVVSFLMVLALGLTGLFSPVAQGYFDWFFQNLQLPAETWLSALIGVLLLTAGIRWAKRTPGWYPIGFLLLTCVLLLGILRVNLELPPAIRPLFDFAPFLREWFLNVPITAASRGLLIGLAIASLASGVRILLGYDRPYGE